MTVFYKMLGRDTVCATQPSYVTWVVQDNPDLDGSRFTGSLPCGSDPTTDLADIRVASSWNDSSRVAWKKPVRAATAAALPANTPTASTLTANVNGALPAIDGVTIAVLDEVLVQNEVAGTSNGIYRVTSIGGASSRWSMERRFDADEGDKLNGCRVPVEEGATYAGAVFRVTNVGTITVGATVLAFAQDNATSATDLSVASLLASNYVRSNGYIGVGSGTQASSGSVRGDAQFAILARDSTDSTDRALVGLSASPPDWAIFGHNDWEKSVLLGKKAVAWDGNNREVPILPSDSNATALSTADATPTAFAAGDRILVVNDGYRSISANITFFDSSGNVGSWETTLYVKRLAGVTTIVAQIDAPDPSSGLPPVADEIGIGGVSYAVAGTDIEVTVTGKAGTNITWNLSAWTIKEFSL